MNETNLLDPDPFVAEAGIYVVNEAGNYMRRKETLVKAT